MELLGVQVPAEEIAQETFVRAWKARREKTGKEGNPDGENHHAEIDGEFSGDGFPPDAGSSKVGAQPCGNGQSEAYRHSSCK